MFRALLPLLCLFLAVLAMPLQRRAVKDTLQRAAGKYAGKATFFRPADEGGPTGKFPKPHINIIDIVIPIHVFFFRFMWSSWNRWWYDCRLGKYDERSCFNLRSHYASFSLTLESASIRQCEQGERLVLKESSYYPQWQISCRNYHRCLPWLSR